MNKYLFPLIVISASLFAQSNQVEKTNIDQNNSQTRSTKATPEELFDLAAQTDKDNTSQSLTGYSGLKDPSKANAALKEQNYIEVIRYINSEPDHAIRLKWLASKTNEQNPILLYEESIETLLKSHPLTWQDFARADALNQLARYRVYQDSLCYGDPIRQEALQLNQQLEQRFNSLVDKNTVEKLLGESNGQFFDVKTDLLKKNFKAIADGSVTLPPTIWTQPDRNPSAEDCNNTRKSFAQGFLDILNGNEPQNQNENSIEVRQEGNTTLYTNTRDVIQFVSLQLDKPNLPRILNGFNGLKDSTKADEALKNGNYIEVLKYVWSEPDPKVRLNWLSSKTKEAHPVLLDEEAVAIFETSKPLTWQDYARAEALVIISTIRTYQDTFCFTDKSIQAAVDALKTQYIQVLEDKKLVDSDALQKLMDDHKDEIEKKEKEIVLSYLEPIANGSVKLPSPDWVRYHGLASFNNENTSISAEDCEKKRQDFAKLVVEQIKQTGTKQ